ncbi:MAG TPA: FimV/HubP family polar landmark protein [Steroidobacteraceae bacterium]|nr:FimV/HubP family polar landmark protein [Steroidobacteraceae bacterium]
MRLRLLNATALLLAMPGISSALGLGEIQLKSALGAPLNAQIELLASDEELATLKAQLASRDTFARYGLDYPAFLADVQVQVVHLADGRSAIQLSSTAPITEPFATFLVEASWARGRIQHEYTVLFDPPTFAQQQAGAAPVALPGTGNSRASEIARPAAPAQPPRTGGPPLAPPPATRPPASPATQPSPATPRSAAARPSPPVPAAGSSYTVPRGDSLFSIATAHYGEPEAEQAMIAIFRGNPQAFGGNINKLRAGAVLRLPDGADVAAIDRNEARGEVHRQMAEWSGRAAAPATGNTPRLVLVPPAGGPGAGTTAGAGSGQAPAAPQSAPGNRVQLGASGLASVQQSTSGSTGPASPPASTPAATPAPGSQPAPAAATVPPAQVEPATPPPPSAAEKKPPAPAVKPAPTTAAPSLFDHLQRWLLPAGLLLLLVVALAVRAARRRRTATTDDFAPFAVEPPAPEARDISSDTFPLRRPTDWRDPSIVVEEAAAPSVAARREAPRTDPEQAPSAAPTVDVTGAFEQGDPLAEADFHMAYGLYDQAADLVRLAIARDPGRRELQLKLLEVYFVWGNKEQFLQTARELAATRTAAQPGEWEKVVIMGKQLAPEDPLFIQSQAIGPSSVDLNLEGGQNLMDFDLPDDSSRMSQLGGGTGADASGLDFTLDDPGRGSTDDGTAPQRAPHLPSAYAVDGPTVEQPALGIDDTLAGKLGARRAPVGGTDQTAELALDDLGLDLGKLEATGSSLLDDSQLTRALTSGEQMPETLVAGLDDHARGLLEQADHSEATALLPLADLNVTAQVSSLDLDLDVDSNASTGKRETPDFNLDLDVGASEQPAADEHQRTQRIAPAVLADVDATQRDMEPVSMSEVGTKLDLARAYMDMGDPDGARNILNEVLAEGSPAQRQEAQRLLDSIPG